VTPKGRAPVEPRGAQQRAELADEGIEGGLRGPGQPVGPQDLGQLVPGDPTMAVDHEVGEGQPSLPAWECPVVEQSVVAAEGELSREGDAQCQRALQGFAKVASQEPPRPDR
jgi:hypothetical protein